jgi:hypothetical protein
MIAYIIVALVFAVGGFIAGVLVGRSNKSKVEKGVSVGKKVIEGVENVVDEIKK